MREEGRGVGGRKGGCAADFYISGVFRFLLSRSSVSYLLAVRLLAYLLDYLPTTCLRACLLCSQAPNLLVISTQFPKRL